MFTFLSVIPAKAPVGQAAVGRSVIWHRSVGSAGIHKLDPRHIFGEERQVLPEKCSAHIIVGNIKVATISAGALAPALSASVKAFGDDTIRFNDNVLVE